MALSQLAMKQNRPSVPPGHATPVYLMNPQGGGTANFMPGL